MNLTKKQKKALATTIVAIVVLLVVFILKKDSPVNVLVIFGKIIFFTFVLNAALWLLDKKGIVDLKKEQQKREEFGKKLVSNKKAFFWSLLMIIVSFILFVGPIYIFSDPEVGNSSVWKVNNQRVSDFYLYFCVIFYSFNLFVFFFGKNRFLEEKGKKIAHYAASIFTFIFFSIYLIWVRHEAHVFLIAWVLCISINWVQYAMINVHLQLKTNNPQKPNETQP